MAIQFPDNPADGEIFEPGNGNSYRYVASSDIWEIVSEYRFGFYGVDKDWLVHRFADDVNTIKKTGIYEVVSGTTTNLPIDFNGIGFLKHYQHSVKTTDHATQIIYSLTAGESSIWSRVKNAGTWGDWSTEVKLRVASKNDAESGVDNTLIMTPLRVKDAINANGGGSGAGITKIIVVSSNSIWTKPPGLRQLKIALTGGGGSGGNASSSGFTAGSGGGAGGTVIKIYGADELNATESIVIGSGGMNGNNGAASTFKGLTAYGGLAGNPAPGDGIVPGAQGGSASGGDFNIAGGDGCQSSAVNQVTAVGGTGGASIYGSGGAGGKGGVTGSNGLSARAPGAGGGGAAAAGTYYGGTGATGIAVLEEYY